MNPKHLRTIGLGGLTVCVGLTVVSRVPAVKNYGGVFVVAAVLVLVLALAVLVVRYLKLLSRRAQAGQDSGGEGRVRGRGAMAVVICAALVATGVGGYATKARASGYDRLGDSARATQLSSSDLSDEVPIAAGLIAQTYRELTSPSAGVAEAALNRVAEFQYLPRSGLEMRLDAASIAILDELVIVKVPLSTNVEATAPLNYVAFAVGPHSISTDEVSMSFPTSSSAHYKRWTDGAPALDTIVTFSVSSDSSSGDPQGDGMDWRQLNDCLINDLGIHQAVVIGLGLICAAVCAASAGTGCIACVAAAVGFYGGGVAGCVMDAWT